MVFLVNQSTNSKYFISLPYIYAAYYLQEATIKSVHCALLTHTHSPHLEKHTFYYVADFLDFLGIIFKKELIRELSLTLAIC